MSGFYALMADLLFIICQNRDNELGKLFKYWI
jgi:hypothetical protein